MLYTLNLQSDMYQLWLNKIGGEKSPDLFIISFA